MMAPLSALICARFQSTPLCEGRHMLLPRILESVLFQSTPLCEGRQLLCYQIDLLVVLGWFALTVVVGRGLMGICCLHKELIKLFQ